MPADTEDMMMIATPQPASANSNPWSWTTVQSALPDGLPAGALTVIRIRTTGNQSRDWNNTVADLVHATVAQHRPVSYVPVDSDNPQPFGTFTPARSGKGGRIGILLDEDHLVHARDDRGRPRVYGCGVPTIHRVQELVGGMEDNYGPSLVILDGLENARPYRATSQDLVTFPDGVTITRRGVNEWRALEMSGLANTRPHAPTVVVWNDNGSPAHSDAIELLCDVAMVIVEAFSSPDGDVLTISQRACIDQRFPYQKAVHLG